MELPWIDPAAAFLHAAAQSDELAFCYSSLGTRYSGRYSLLAFGTARKLCSDRWEDVSDFLPSLAEDAPAFGYIAYEMLHALEQVPACAPSFIEAVPIQLAQFPHLMRFDHERRVVSVHAAAEFDWRPFTALPPPCHADVSVPPLRYLRSNMSKDAYLAHVAATREAIHEGAFYQANITRKWFGESEAEIDAPRLFLRLHRLSPTPYGAFLRLGGLDILSSSPELFLRAGADGTLETRPIKGTLGAAQDSAALRNSAKDRAENLMIVDLMRNDLARTALPSSVEVSSLYDIDSFTTLHHMSSDIRARLAPGKHYLDALKACFPPGSMTGAPKVAAMRWCAERERIQRGIYSGALGWFSPQACELSVVIRTLLLQGRRFEFQVGGGIVADSEPLKEWQETLVKAKGIAQALGIEPEDLANI